MNADINECSSLPCHRNATCYNSVGSFECTCDGSYQGNGFNCILLCEDGYYLRSHNETTCSKLINQVSRSILQIFPL